MNLVGTVNLLEALFEAAPRRAAPFRLDRRGLRSGAGAADHRERETARRSRRMRPRRPRRRSRANRPCARPGSTWSLRAPSSTKGPGRDERFAVGSWTRQIAELELRRRRRAARRRPQRGAGHQRTSAMSVAPTGCCSIRPCRPGRTTSPRAGRCSSPRSSTSSSSWRSARSASCPIPTRLRPSDVEVVWGDATKLHEATGWSPEIPLEQTLADTLDYAREAVTRAART